MKGTLDIYYEKLGELRLKKHKQEPEGMGVDLTQSGISKLYFKRVREAVRTLKAVANELLDTASTYNALRSHILQPVGNDVRLCVLIDVVRCYGGLNHSTSFNTPEGVALMMLMAELLEVGQVDEYEMLHEVEPTTLQLIDLVPYIDDVSRWARLATPPEEGEDALLVSAVLKQTTPDLDARYRVALYRYCKRVAEVDGTLTPAEQEWLEEVARLDDGDPTTDLIRQE